ncbi:unnamed protein product [Didymodactylos carnosus]|uniref:Uncharacterized protein n=1 Tax=Didymodactylos carnosus TaxID=1234261 RepID=A0A815STC3_9BILA|nr:unnamed protein product [Didymodactylos carnosus]CAF4355768.1 unnamed protein product [Didymodactylos carnosus]
MILDGLWLSAASEFMIKFSYYPIDFRNFSTLIELKSNSSDTLIQIPYHFEFKISTLETTPHALIDIGSILLHGRNYNSSITIKNKIDIVSQCDPVMTIDGKLSNRLTKILIIGHLMNDQQDDKFDHANKSHWDDLQLISSQWLHQFYSNSKKLFFISTDHRYCLYM